MQLEEIKKEITDNGYRWSDFSTYVDENKMVVGEIAMRKFIGWRDSLKTTVIDEKNFNEYFFDSRWNKPKRGQILACYETKAEILDGNFKRDLVDILINKNQGSIVAVKLLQKITCATEASAIAAIKEMGQDILNGMSSEEVANKPYEISCRFFYYTYKECLPTNDPKWWSVSLVKVNGATTEQIDAIVNQAAVNDDDDPK